MILLIGASLLRSSPRKNSVRDPFPAGEGYGWTDHSFRIMITKECCFNLPPLIEAILPDPRDITLRGREKTGDVGFSLRRSVVVNRSPDQPSRYQLLSRLVLKIISKFNEYSYLFFLQDPSCYLCEASFHLSLAEQVFSAGFCSRGRFASSRRPAS